MIESGETRHREKKIRGKKRRIGTYSSVGGSVFLLGRNDGTFSRRGVESALPPHDGLARDRLGSRSIPVIHFDGFSICDAVGLFASLVSEQVLGKELGGSEAVVEKK